MERTLKYKVRFFLIHFFSFGSSPKRDPKGTQIEKTKLQIRNLVHIFVLNKIHDYANNNGFRF